MRRLILAFVFLVLISGCVETQSQISQQQEEIPQKEVDLEITSIECENTEGDINVPNDYGAHCWGAVANNGYKKARYVKINFVFHDEDGIVGETSTQPISGGGDVPPGESRNFDMEIEIKRPYTRYNYDVTYPEEFVS